MNFNTANSGFGRRSFLVLLVSALGSALGLYGWSVMSKKPIAKAAPFVKPKEKWTADHFYDFLSALPADTMLALKKSLGILDGDATETQLKGNDQDARDIQKHTLRLSSNVLAYPFRDETKLNYHDLATWVCGKAGVSQELIQSAPTFALERELHKLLFAQMWDKLNSQKREELLAKIDPNGAIKDKAAIAALGGVGALAALSATAALTGFAFYTTMSVTIATVAGAVGATLPFATYAGASSLIGALSGPVGWAIMGIAALGGMALVGRADRQKTAAFIVQLHALKVEALIAAGVPERDVFHA
jgi:uncharacterized protein YaaW (UPF0174 family)